jgi:hypothetical protein
MAINSALEAGVAHLTIAKNFNASKFALSRHRNRCLKPVATGESAGDQTDKWIRRCDDLYLQAGAAGDLKSQIAALSAAIRGLQAAAKREAEKAEQEGEISSDPTRWSPADRKRVQKLLDYIVPRFADLPNEVVSEIAALDGDRGAAKQALANELRYHAEVWINLRSGIEANPETWRLLLYCVERLCEKNAALQEAKLGELK